MISKPATSHVSPTAPRPARDEPVGQATAQEETEAKFLVEDASLIAEPYQGGAFVAVLAVGFALITLLTRLFTGEAHWWALIVAGVLALVGGGIIILEMPNGGLLQQMVEAAFTASQYLWPLVLVSLGLWIIFKKKSVEA